LSHTINFATKTQNDSNFANDNIFVNNLKLSSSFTFSIISGLLDHDGQFITIKTVLATDTVPFEQQTRKIMKQS
jgi:hypothetical protein